MSTTAQPSVAPDFIQRLALRLDSENKAKQQSRRQRPYEVRYATENYSNALWGTYRDYDQAVLAKHQLLALIHSSPYAGMNQIAKSVDVY